MSNPHAIAAEISRRFDELARDGKVNRDATIDSLVTQMMQDDIEEYLKTPEAWGATQPTFHPPQYPTWDDLRKTIERLVAEKNIAVDNLTREQFAEAITQAIQCGDFTRCVVRDSDRQHVSYIPFRKEQELQAEIDRLNEIIANSHHLDE